MRKNRFVIIVLSGLLVLAACQQELPRTREDFTKDWRFSLGDDSLAYTVDYNDSGWRKLDLPHDWSIEGAFSIDHPSTPNGGALPGGIGWYRKSFVLEELPLKKQIFITFDGVYQHSSVWINGHLLGTRPNGYITFQYELTPFLNAGKNMIAVRVDNSLQPNSRWYTGSGIYRNVWLESMNEVHVDLWGTYITTPEVNDKQAKVNLQVSVKKATLDRSSVYVKTILKDQFGNKVAQDETQSVETSDSLIVFKQDFIINHPQCWSTDNPFMYKAITLVFHDGREVDHYETSFGVRSFSFDPQKGFILNGEVKKIHGVCLHHDLGALGASLNSAAIKRQLRIMKEMGCNAIRTAHNPPAPELLSLCDELGFIVQDEAFDVWKKKKVKYDYHIYWDQWHEWDLRDMVLRDRNHPSVMMWSIGNEIREQFDSTGTKIVRELTDIVKSLDTTRPVTSALTENDPAKNFIIQGDALDLIGFNYKQAFYKHFPEIYPGKAFHSSESMSAYATRGYYQMPSDSIMRWPAAYDAPLVGGNDQCMVSAYDHVSAYWGSSHEETWKVIKKYDFISGMFLWSGFDYLGEPSPYPWPARSSYFGVVDLAGFPKDAYYMYQSEWSDQPMLHLFPHWNWKEGQTIDVWAYYNHADEVELFVNEVSQGVRSKKEDEFHVMWRVDYQPGTIRAESRRKGMVVMEESIHTAGPAFKIELTADRSFIQADGRDLAFVTVKVLDEEGNLVPDADQLIHFEVEGEGFIAGVDNGYQASMEPFKANQRKVFNGMCLAILQSNGREGYIALNAYADGLESSKINIRTE